MTKKNIVISLAVLTLLAIGATAYFRQQTPQQSSANSTQIITATSTQAQSATSSVVADTHSGMKLYRNKEFGFEFWYPEEWRIMDENRDINPFIKLKVNVSPSPQGIYRHFKPFEVLISTVEHAERLLTFVKSNGTPIEAIIDGNNVIGHNYFGPADYTTYIIIFDDYGVFIRNENKENVHEFNRILSTFKFIK